MLTRWGAALDPDQPLPEYPRPQLARPRWVNLNGRWEHAFTASSDRPSAYSGEIVVPFSPEAPLSGVNRQLQPDEWLWYRRCFASPAIPPSGHLLLHFGAVDQSCTVWVNGHEVGSHTGGYLPFSLEITDALTGGDDQLLEVRVRDLSEHGQHARGKQRLDRGTIWYTAQSGIWQTVWLEPLPAAYVAELVLLPHLDIGALEVTVIGSSVGPGSQEKARVVVSSDGTVVAEAIVPVGQAAIVPLAQVRPWTPQTPHLYDLEVRLGEDVVTSYAAIRSFGVGEDSAGHARLLLNDEPFAHVGVLDQGYWPDGLLTPPSDEAMIHDIETMRSLGFNVLRKHVKIEPLRWYAHCDRIGMLVWQDMVNGGGRYRHLVTALPATRPVRLPDRLHRLYHRGNRAGREEFREEVRETVRLLHNVVSIAVWTPFNEGWGQFDANAVSREVTALDPTRQVNHVSGWVDQGGGEIRSFHRYVTSFRMPRPRLARFWARFCSHFWARPDRRVVALTEYGGTSLRVEGHDWSRREFGYARVEDTNELVRSFTALHEPLVAAVRAGLAATVYTQLSDVEDELNGLLTWDREVLKLDPAVVRRVTAALAAAHADVALRPGSPPTATR